MLTGFTVLSTVGYGNQAPTTSGGKALVYSLGLFFIVLSFAGHLYSAIWDDLLVRFKLTESTDKTMDITYHLGLGRLWLDVGWV
jgi:hypothetical protein